MIIKHQFEPVVFKDSEILILGSFPSVKSRENNFYYMNKYNRFWKVLSNLYNIDFLGLSIDEKINYLKDLKIGIYDVVLECEIIGSQDSSIKNIKVVQLDKLIEGTNIKRIYLNGNKAYDIFKKHFPDLLNISKKLPSTSPANAAYTIEKLINEWKVILNNGK